VAYSTPLTAVSSTPLTAAQWNASVRDNMLITPAALATTAGQLWVSTGANAGAMRAPVTATVVTPQTTSSSSFTDLATAGPSVTVATGTTAFVAWIARHGNNTLSAWARAAVTVSGATTAAANIDYGTAYQAYTAGADANLGGSFLMTNANYGLNAGTNTFKLQYRTDGTGTATFSSRTLTVIPF
jgi:uncharacterized membrane protein